MTCLTNLNSRVAGIVNYRAPSFGTFSTQLAPRYFYGVPRNVDFSGVVMDIDRSAYQLVDRQGKYQNKLNYLGERRTRGSMLESLIPEQLLSIPENPVHSISAVKAIQLAAQEGQKIWYITQENLDVALDNINLQAHIEDEIRQNINIGRVVTTHEFDVIYHGMVATGYMIVDPLTGSGSALIDSGEDGSDGNDDEGWLDILNNFTTLLGLISERVAYADAVVSFINGTKCLVDAANSGSFFSALLTVPAVSLTFVFHLFSLFVLFSAVAPFVAIGWVFFWGAFITLVFGTLWYLIGAACEYYSIRFNIRNKLALV